LTKEMECATIYLGMTNTPLHKMPAASSPSASRSKRHPAWLRVRAPGGPQYIRLTKLLDELHLHTVCQEARCPNIGECFQNRTATFLLLGDVCTRGCRFCAIAKGKPAPLDEEEPERVAQAIARLGLNHAVLTSVNRDDLPDGGAHIFARTVERIRAYLPRCGVEVLIPDFQGDASALRVVLAARPDILNHNLETVPRLYPRVRPRAGYRQSLTLLERAKGWGHPGMLTKSGLMLGLGESEEELLETMADLRAVGCDVLTLGQYLRPTPRHLPVERYYTPQEFVALARKAHDMGFQHVESGPLVRSSYHAHEQSEAARLAA